MLNSNLVCRILAKHVQSPRLHPHSKQQAEKMVNLENLIKHLNHMRQDLQKQFCGGKTGWPGSLHSRRLDWAGIPLTRLPVSPSAQSAAWP